MLFLLLFQFSIRQITDGQSAKFIRLTTNDGLSQGHISAILKDKEGFMWFATNGGLDKYDGYTSPLTNTILKNRRASVIILFQIYCKIR